MKSKGNAYRAVCEDAPIENSEARVGFKKTLESKKDDEDALYYHFGEEKKKINNSKTRYI